MGLKNSETDKIHKVSNSPSGESDDLLAGRGAPALMSLKEPAIRLLKERYSETFALTSDNGRMHLFLIKFGLWALIRTFARKDFEEAEGDNNMHKSLTAIEKALQGKDSDLLRQLDESVERSKKRIQQKAVDFKMS